MLSITHTPLEGTTLEGDPRPHQQVLKAAGWRWSRNLGAWFVPRSRDRALDSYGRRQLDRLADELRAVGFDVEVQVDNDERRSVAEAELDRAERVQARVERFEGRAQAKAADASARLERHAAVAGAIPFGQPVMGAADRRRRQKLHGQFDRAMAIRADALHAQGRADAARGHQRHHEQVDVTLRRITRLEAERRRVDRQLAGATGEWAEDLTVQAAELDEQLTHWRAQVAAAEAAGVKLWGPADFKPGDRVNARGSATVKRVNKTTLTVVWDVMPTCPQRIPYSDVSGPLTNTEA